MILRVRCILKTAVILLIVSAIVSCGVRPSRGRPAAVNGVMDLSAWNIARDGAVRLDGQWEFYWRQLLEPADFAGKNRVPTGFFKVPDTWSNYKAQGRTLPGRGYATYRLLIRMGENRGLYVLKLHEINNAHRLWINGDPVSIHGVVAAADREMTYKNYPKLAHYRFDGGTAELVMQVSNYNDIVAGILRSVKIGTPEQIENERDLRLSFNLFLFGSLLIMGLYHLGLFVLRRKEISALFFGIFCMLISLRSILTEERIVFTMFPWLDWIHAIRIEFLTLLGAPLFAWFLMTLYREEFNRKIITLFNICGAAFAIIVILMPPRIFIPSLVAFQVLMAVMGVYACIGLARAVAKRREGSMVLAAGFAILFCTLINDILHSRMLIQTSYVVPFGLFIFIFSQSFVLSMRFVRSFAKVESMSQKLEVYADHLEDMVVARTTELEAERNKLKSRNETIEKELALARRIQQQLIPDESPADYVYSFYKPMDSVGGDFYDFIRFSDSGRLGIFLSDVSGHGVPAAFITSMIKSIILQSGPHLSDPAALLLNLNRLLIDKSGGNFVTAFYGIFDPATRRITYSNAGHYPPFVISGENVSTLDRRRSVPLAIMDNNELTNTGKEYKNCDDELPDRSRLVLYTDGLIEVMVRDDPARGFDEDFIGKAFADLAHLPKAEFVRRLMAGGDSSEDDVCVICLDVGKE